MSMYNAIFGTSPFMAVLSNLLQPRKFGRLRDIWLEKTDEGHLRIAVYTRNGGGNRGDYMPDWSCDPLYLYDVDDDFDSTYATIYFAPPKDSDAKLKQMGIPDGYTLADLATKMVLMSDRWQCALDSMVSK